MNNNELMVAEKNGNRVLHRVGKRWTLKVCSKGFAGTVFASEDECLKDIEMLKKELPHFQFEICKKEDFTNERVMGGTTYVFRK
jgi:hypothetical protein